MSDRGVPPDLLRRVCTAGDIPCATTDDADDAAAAFVQARAHEAVEVASAIGDGFNVFATGPAGIGKSTIVADWLREWAASRPAPPDVVQLVNFDDPRRPLALTLPAGRGGAQILEADMAKPDRERFLDHGEAVLDGAVVAREHEDEVQRSPPAPDIAVLLHRMLQLPNQICICNIW